MLWDARDTAPRWVSGTPSRGALGPWEDADLSLYRATGHLGSLHCHLDTLRLRSAIDSICRNAPAEAGPVSSLASSLVPTKGPVCAGLH